MSLTRIVMSNATRGGMLLLLILAAGCGGPTAATTPTIPTTPTQPSSPFDNLVGNYTLTLEIDDTCALVPPSERTRHYDAVIVETHWMAPPTRPIDIVGGGFTESTLMGELWSDGNGKFHVKWNDFDIGCETAEPIAQVGRLYLCGDAPATVSDSSISATIAGSASLVGGGSCNGSHRLTFVRKAQ